MADGTEQCGFPIDPIGTISTPFDGTADPPRQGFELNARGELVVAERYREGLEGLADGDEIDVVWFAHRADRSVIRARDRGVFSTRSPERPNPICVTRCTIESIDGPAIEVCGVDMVDGTPLLDLKAPIE